MFIFRVSRIGIHPTTYALSSMIPHPTHSIDVPFSVVDLNTSCSYYVCRNSSPDHPSSDESMAANNDTRRSPVANNTSGSPRYDSCVELDNYGRKLVHTAENKSENVVGTSEPEQRELEVCVGDAPPFATRRGRPDSAPPKSYPYANSLASPGEKAGAGAERKVGHDVASEPSRRCREHNLPQAVVKVKTRARGGWGTARAWGASNTSMKAREAKARLSLSVGAGSSARGEGRAIFENEESCGVGRNEEDREEVPPSEVPLSEVPLSSQEFGLRRWKEYAVLRYVDSCNIAICILCTRY